jgi:hypothetical protein
MIPALIRPAIGDRPEQFQQVIADLGDRGRRYGRNRLATSNSNARLNHGEAPVVCEESAKRPLALPDLHRALPPDTPHRDSIATSLTSQSATRRPLMILK